VAARGLGIEQLAHVADCDVPSAPGSCVHRIGRVGRAGREGTAIALVEPCEHRMLKAIERAAGQPIRAGELPGIAGLRARRLAVVRAALSGSLLYDDGPGSFRAVVEPLGAGPGLFEVALAAVKLAHGMSGAPHEEDELPEAGLPSADDRNDRRKASGRARRRRAAAGRTARLLAGTGRSAGARPQDLAGAVTGEPPLSGRDTGATEIAGRFSLVEVPEPAAGDVAAALGQAGIKGQRAAVRRERYPSSTVAPSSSGRRLGRGKARRTW
jgi:ATP-dependent RNA helicase DeaD